MRALIRSFDPKEGDKRFLYLSFYMKWQNGFTKRWMPKVIIEVFEDVKRLKYELKQ